MFNSIYEELVCFIVFCLLSFAGICERPYRAICFKIVYEAILVKRRLFIICYINFCFRWFSLEQFFACRE